MPTYDYKCKTCDTPAQEFVLPFNHDKPVCDVCHNEMQQVYPAAPTHFKGTGFYKTDN